MPRAYPKLTKLRKTEKSPIHKVVTSSPKADALPIADAPLASDASVTTATTATLVEGTTVAAVRKKRGRPSRSAVDATLDSHVVVERTTNESTPSSLPLSPQKTPKPASKKPRRKYYPRTPPSALLPPSTRAETVTPLALSAETTAAQQQQQQLLQPEELPATANDTAALSLNSRATSWQFETEMAQSSSVVEACVAPRAAPAPSLLDSLAACFGWRLAACGFTESGAVHFLLRHRADPAVRADVQVGEEPSTMPTAAESVANVRQGAGDGVWVNGVAMPLAACAAHLHQLSQRASHAASAVTSTGEAPPRSPPFSLPLPDSRSAAPSPMVVRPPPMTAAERQRAARRDARKRQRSASPSPRGPSLPRLGVGVTSATSSSPPSSAAVESNADSDTAEPPNPDARMAALGSANESATAHPPNTSGGAAAVAKGKAERSTSPPATSPSPPPLSREVPPREQSDDTEGSEERMLASLVPDGFRAASEALAAPHDEDSSGSAFPDVPAPRSPATRRALLLARQPTPAPPSPASTAAVPDMPSSAPNAQLLDAPHDKVSPSSPARGRRTQTATPAAAAANDFLPETTAPASGAGTNDALSLHGSAKHSFWMPYLAPASHNTQSTPSAPQLLCGSHDRGNVTHLLPFKSFSGADGWSTRSSRCWLAHTHAVSRAMELAPTNLEAPDQQKAEIVAEVRAALQERWRRRSSLWRGMEESLRLSVGSGRLRGDALEAGVQALQEGEAEQQRYGATAATQKQDDGGVVASDSFRVFPCCPPRPMLPVSGKAIVEAQHRISAAEEGERQEALRPQPPPPPRYVTCPGGIPAADRILIDRTFTTRGSYLVATTAPLTQADKEDERKRSERVATTSVLPSLPALEVNPQEDLHYHIYKRYMPKDMQEALAAEGALEIGPDGIGPVQKSSPQEPSSSSALQRQDHELHRTRAIAGDDGDDDVSGRGEQNDEDVESNVQGPESPLPLPKQAGSAPSSLLGAEFSDPSNIDYILRYRPAIQRIPMPDVESRYGL